MVRGHSTTTSMTGPIFNKVLFFYQEVSLSLCLNLENHIRLDHSLVSNRIIKTLTYGIIPIRSFNHDGQGCGRNAIGLLPPQIAPTNSSPRRINGEISSPLYNLLVKTARIIRRGDKPGKFEREAPNRASSWRVRNSRGECRFH